MKRLLTILAILCLLMGSINVAQAAIEVTGQPETQTVKAGGTVTFSVKAKGVGNAAITWHFISPDGQEDITGKKLSARFSGLKVNKPNSQNITLKKVPEEMHGWSVYCHLGKPSAGVDTEPALLLIEGMDAPETEDAGGTEEADTAGEDEDFDSETDEAEDFGDETEDAGETEDSGDETEDVGEAEDFGDETEDADATADDEENPEYAGETPAESGSAGAAEGSAAENMQIRGFAEGNQEYQYMQLGTYYYTESGGKKPLLWRVLYRKGNIAQLITENIIDAMQMLKVDDYYNAVTKRSSFKSRYNTPYEETDLYYWLNGEMAAAIFEDQDFSSAVVPHRIKEAQKKEADIPEEPGYQTGSQEPLTPEEQEKFPYGKDLFYIMTYADMKNGDFGFPDTTFGNTKENDNEKAIPESGRRKAYATPYAKNKVQHPDWKKDTKMYKLDVVTVYKGMSYGGSSPYWAIKRRKGYYMSGIVGANGHLSWSNMASVRIGVRPAAIVDLNKLRVTGGNGTEENPWVMEPIR